MRFAHHYNVNALSHHYSEWQEFILLYN